MSSRTASRASMRPSPLIRRRSYFVCLWRMAATTAARNASSSSARPEAVRPTRLPRTNVCDAMACARHDAHSHLDANRGAQGIHFLRNVSEHPFATSFAYHLDLQKLGFPDSWRTRGFYERSRSALPLCARNTSKACVLDAVTRRPLANQLATDQPR